MIGWSTAIKAVSTFDKNSLFTALKFYNSDVDLLSRWYNHRAGQCSCCILHQHLHHLHHHLRQHHQRSGQCCCYEYQDLWSFTINKQSLLLYIKCNFYRNHRFTLQLSHFHYHNYHHWQHILLKLIEIEIIAKPTKLQRSYLISYLCGLWSHQKMDLKKEYFYIYFCAS